MKRSSVSCFVFTDQSSFLQVTDVVNAPKLDGTGDADLVRRVGFSLDKRFARAVYDSCKDVTNPATSGIS